MVVDRNPSLPPIQQNKQSQHQQQQHQQKCAAEATVDVVPAAEMEVAPRATTSLIV